jgi:DNA-binding XRE family transcriptional regulator
MDRNIDATADRLIAALNHAKDYPSSPQPDGRKPEDVRFLAYTLTFYRTQRGKVLSEGHLRLLHAALGIQRPSIAVTEALGMPRVQKIDEFLEASAIQAADPDISENKLAKSVGVGRDTIKRWRAMPQFYSRIDAVLIDKRLKASAIQVDEPDISEDKLAKLVGVGRDTIKRWRANPQFHFRIDLDK